MSLVTPSFNGITAGLLTSRSYPDVLEYISYQRLPTDPIYTSKLKLVSLQTGFGYVVYDKDNLLVTSGDYTVNPIFYSSVLAYTNADAITVYFLKYGNSYKKSTFAITNIETLMFMAQEINNNITLSTIAVAALTGIAVDKVTKTVTVSSSHSQADVYDYLQYFQSLPINVDLLTDGEIFSTVLGTNYTLKSTWKLIFTVAPTGTWNVQGDVTFNAQFDVSNFNVSGTLFFDAPSTLTVTDSQIGSLDTVTGDETVSYTPSGTSNTPIRLDVINITINVPKPSLYITVVSLSTGLPVSGASLYLKTTGIPPPEGTEIFKGFTDVDGKVTIPNYNYISTQQFVGRVRAATYKTSPIQFTLTGSDVNVSILMIKE